MTHASSAEFTRQWVKAQPLVTSFVFASIRSSHDAEDILQEVATAALADFSEYDSQRPFVAWALGIARFRVLNYYRRHAQEKLLFDDAALLAFAQAHEQLESQASARRHALDECLKQLDGRKLTALRMRYTEETSVQSIAELLVTTTNAVSLMLHKVRKSLATCVERQLSREGSL